MELTDRELALRWWRRKTIQEKKELMDQVKFPISIRHHLTLTGNEIEWIWRNQPYNDVGGPVNYELQFCEKCCQMTNHLKGICQKCKGGTNVDKTQLS